MKKLSSFIGKSAVVILFVASLLILPLINVAHATASNPSWWVNNNNVFSQYDDYQYKNGRTHQGIFYSGSGVDSHILSAGASYDGVSAVGPRPAYDGVNDVDSFFTSDAGSSQEEEWECTELVKRYLYLEYGVPSLGNTFGNEVVDNYVSAYPSNFKKIINDGSAQVYPKPGDILSYGSSRPGHTALVKSVTNQSSGSATVQLLEQNSSSTGLTNQTFTNWQFQNGVDDDPNNSNTVTGWLTPKTWIDMSPSDTTYDSIYGMAATSATNIWAVGQESKVGYSFQPVTYHNTGLGFNKVYPPSQGIYQNHYLYGIAASSSGDAWIVGRIYGNPSYNTLAYRWNGSSWGVMPSDSSTGGSVLKGVTIDPSGGIWAVGQWYKSGLGQTLLIEKWNGTRLASVSANFTGVGILNSVSFSSAINGWAVGVENSNYVAYHYDGSTWTGTSGTYCPNGLTSVATISNTEAWATGCGTTGIVHYTSANGWQQDTSFTPAGGVTSVSANSSSDVWMAGTQWIPSISKNVPYVIHYDGNHWTQIAVPSSITAGWGPVLQSVTSIPGAAWAGGQLVSSSATTNKPVPLVLKSP